MKSDTLYLILALYLAVINLTGFAMMGIDKRKAVKKRWRVRESTFFLTAVIGGSVGCMIGMRTFHHKTKHWYFVTGIPLIALAEAALCIWLCMLLR